MPVNANAYYQLLKSRELNPAVLKDFDQTGFWTLWGESGQIALKEMLGKSSFEKLDKLLKTLTPAPAQIETREENGDLVLHTSYHELPALKPHKKSKNLSYFPDLSIPYHKIHGSLRASMAPKIKAPNLKEVGHMIILSSGLKDQNGKNEKELYCPNLTRVTETLRIWQGVKLFAPNLSEIDGDLIIEESHDNSLKFPSLKRVGGSIFCRKAKAISLPKLEHVDGVINGYELKMLEIPKLKRLKSIKLNFKNFTEGRIKQIIANLNDGGLKALEEVEKKRQETTIVNPTGAYLYNLIKSEIIRRSLLKLNDSNLLSID
jgi:hypothetical protein